MVTFTNIIGFFGGVVVLVLAGIGVVAVIAHVSRSSDERRRLQAQANEAERQMMEIGRQAQLAILGEALRSYRSRDHQVPRHEWTDQA